MSSSEKDKLPEAMLQEAQLEKEPSLILNQFLPFRLVNIAKRVSDTYSWVYNREFGLSIPEWRILARLGEQPGLSSKLIGEITLMDKSKVSRGVKQLEDKGLLAKNKDQQDNRVYYLSLTEEGQQLYHSIVPTALDWEAELLQALDVSEYRDLFRVLEKLDRRLENMVDKKSDS
ncbi:MarR family winged helix-turn-helix transcriptional regulator [uncultured Pseudoteredinibacter sp.]|uniref:MarR family winged helix-turn-helix transcriptional regulator n=1 Tax=uncultured Pseudoteredinibacter sp. TaxID=1641701 RepID=UPI002620AD2F|nr:MarR family winged helix-turn-helix transcriptional regulator [uncultured Pseudoteredinibacter sp.]